MYFIYLSESDRGLEASVGFFFKRSDIPQAAAFRNGVFIQRTERILVAPVGHRDNLHVAFVEMGASLAGEDKYFAEHVAAAKVHRWVGFEIALLSGFCHYLREGRAVCSTIAAEKEIKGPGKDSFHPLDCIS